MNLPSDPPQQAGLLDILLSGWKLVVAAVLAGIAAALLYLHAADRKYLVTLALVPTEENGRPTPSVGGGIGNLATLAGVNLSGGSGSLQFELIPDAILSQETAQEIATDTRVMQQIFAPYWDETAQEWREPSGFAADIRRAGRNLFARLFGGDAPGIEPPGGRDLLTFMEKEIGVEQERKRPVVKLSMLHRDPAFAKAFLLRLWGVADKRMKNAALARSSANIEYLSARLAETQTIDYRLYLLNVMSQEEKRRMTTSSALPFVSEPFGGPVASARPVYPDVFMALAAGIGTGLALGFAMVGFRYRKDLKPIFANMLQ